MAYEDPGATSAPGAPSRAISAQSNISEKFEIQLRRGTWLRLWIAQLRAPFTSLTELEIKRRRPWLCGRDARRVAWRLPWRGGWRDASGLARCERGGRRSGDRRFRDARQLRDDDELRVRGVRLLWCGVRRLASTFVLLELRNCDA